MPSQDQKETTRMEHEPGTLLVLSKEFYFHRFPHKEEKEIDVARQQFKRVVEEADRGRSPSSRQSKAKT